MVKCKRNILLIFGYLLIIPLLFLPCQKTVFNYSGERINVRKDVIFLPFFINKIVKFEKYKDWEKIEVPIILKHLEEIRIKEKEIRTREDVLGNWAAYGEFLLDPEIKLDSEELEYLKGMRIWLGENYDTKKFRNDIKHLKSEIYELKEIDLEKKKEFNNKFGEKPYHYKLIVEIFSTELVIILLAGGFTYILFCVALKKREKKEEK